MNITWEVASLARNLDSVLQCIPDKGDSVWMQGLYHFYPEISRETLLTKEGQGRKEYLIQKLTEIYHEKMPLITQKQIAYQAHWDARREVVVQALSEAFSLDCRCRFENMTGWITLNPVCPRYLEEQSFDVFYLNSERGTLGMALHEMIHFVWFFVWEKLFTDDPAGYERPHLPWIFSEMAVEPVMRDSRLKELNPYFSDGGCVYDCFYSMQVKGRPILEWMNQLYTSRSIQAFMKDGLAFCQENELEIRRQMAGYL